MSYLKLLNAKRNSGKQPSMKPLRLSSAQKALADEGKCIKCGKQNPSRNSYICLDCQAKNTIEDIRDDITALRQKILGRPGK